METRTPPKFTERQRVTVSGTYTGTCDQPGTVLVASQSGLLSKIQQHNFYLIRGDNGQLYHAQEKFISAIS